MTIFPVDVARALNAALWQSINDGFSIKCACVIRAGVGIVVTNLSTVALAFLSNTAIVTHLKSTITHLNVNESEAQQLLMNSLCSSQTAVNRTGGMCRLDVALRIPISLPHATTLSANMSIDLVDVKDMTGVEKDTAVANAIREYVVAPMTQIIECFSQLTAALTLYLPPDKTLESVLENLPRNDAKEALSSTPTHITTLIAEHQVRRLQTEHVSATAARVPQLPQRRERDETDVPASEATQATAARDPAAEKMKKIKRVLR
jgi:hypothetical protein